MAQLKEQTDRLDKFGPSSMLGFAPMLQWRLLNLSIELITIVDRSKLKSISALYFSSVSGGLYQKKMRRLTSGWLHDVLGARSLLCTSLILVFLHSA